MAKRALLTALLLVAAWALSAQTIYNAGQHKFWVGIVPTSSTNVVAGTVYLVHASFSTAGGAGTITVSDRGTDCGGSPCLFANAIAIAANSTYTMDFAAAGGGLVAPSGLSIVATGTVQAHIHYDTQLQ